MLGLGLVGELKDRCGRLRLHLSVPGKDTESEIEDLWPGGKLNPKRDTLAWARCYADLSRIAGRSERPERDTTDADEAAITDALAETPVDVVITKPDGSQMVVGAYPKSFRALEWFRARGKRIAWLIDKRNALEERQDPSVLPLLERIGEEVVAQYALLAEVATTPGCWLPWEPADVPNEPREWAAFIAPGDLLRIYDAFIEANVVRLAIVQRRLSPGKGDDKPLTWPELFAMRTAETGVGSAVLLRDRSLVSEIASALKASDVQRRNAATA